MGVKDDIRAFNHGLIKLAGNTDSMVDPTAFKYAQNLMEDFITQMSMKKIEVIQKVASMLPSDGSTHNSNRLMSCVNNVDGYHSFVMNEKHGPNVICFVNENNFHIRESGEPKENNYAHLIEKGDETDLGYVLSITLKHTREEINKLIFAMENDSHDESSKNILISTINNNAHNHGVRDFGKIKGIFLDINSVFFNLLQDD